jgi:hypothetical protein
MKRERVFGEMRNTATRKVTLPKTGESTGKGFEQFQI